MITIDVLVPRHIVEVPTPAIVALHDGAKVILLNNLLVGTPMIAVYAEPAPASVILITESPAEVVA